MSVSAQQQQRPLPLTFPLHGSRLIEASAGTGKTFTLAALYLRLVLGHGGDNGFVRPLLPPDILVVTFTEAATKELRERIRDRLAHAARFFSDPEHHPGDPILTELKADYPQHDQQQECAHHLNAAAQWMDEAAIYTIHSFCKRMLQQHAFDSGSLFSLELNNDIEEQTYQAACDYWRNIVSAVFPDHTALLLQEEKLSHPQDLLNACRPLMGLDNSGASGIPDTVSQWVEATLSQSELETKLRQRLADELPAFKTWFAEALANKWLSGNSYKDKAVREMLQALESYIQGAPLPGQQIFALERLSSSGMKFNKKGQDHKPTLRTPDLLDSVLEGREQTRLPRTDFLQHAATWIDQRLAQFRQQSATMGYDDMINRLQEALEGSNGARLAAAIREQFPVALIDEFQDTDPKQYAIFSALYQNQPNTGWFMIGDPKQAIYAFRGADVFTYLKAHRATEGRHYTLERNFRSSEAMVTATNELFGYSDRQFGNVFMMGDDIPFQAVSAQGRKEQLLIDGKAYAGLQLWVEDSEKAISSGKYREQQAAYAATEITRLLNGAEAGHTGFQQDDAFKPLRPRDIAVLVRDYREADAIRQALQARQVRSVYLSDHDSVFHSDEAADLLLVLRACSAPESDRLVRSALACATLGLSYPYLDAINQDEERWEAVAEQFHHYRWQWQQQGVLPMLRQLLMDFSVPARLRGSLNGERSLTNLLHLSELLQQASSQLDGEQALMRYLEDALSDAQQQSDDAILRLESDDDRVQVITIHKSKGLEYPLVFLPFICSFRPKEQKKPPLSYHQDDALIVKLEPNEEETRLADQERLAEDMRLLYVALTRACHACVMGIAPFARGNNKNNQLHLSAAGRLLFGGGLDNDQLSAQAKPLNSDAITVAAPPAADTQCYQPTERQRSWHGALTPQSPHRAPWWIASYSALKHSGERLAPASARGDQLHDKDELGTDREPDPGTIHAFPRGALPGTLLHDVLEQAGRDGFSQSLADGEALDATVAEKLAARHWQDHETLTQQWWRQALGTDLPMGGESVRLETLTRYVPELEFLLPAQQVSVTQLDTLICQHIAPGTPRPRLEADTLNGMLKGFIDLVFEHKGRYYVLDYKSNWLGPDNYAYTGEAMFSAVLEKRYEVQYVLYLLALHRLLKNRLGEAYEPSHHLGGAVYVFLRGFDSAQRGTLFDRPCQELIDNLDTLFQGETA